MDAPKEKRENSPLEGFKDYCFKRCFFRILQKVFNQFFVVKEKPQESTDRGNKHEEEEVDHEHICQFVLKVEAEKVSTFTKEVEDELLNIAFKEN